MLKQKFSDLDIGLVYMSSIKNDLETKIDKVKTALNSLGLLPADIILSDNCVYMAQLINAGLERPTTTDSYEFTTTGQENTLDNDINKPTDSYVISPIRKFYYSICK